MKKIQDIQTTIESFYKAFHEKDWEQFGTYLTDDFQYFTDNCIIQSKADFINFLRNDVWIGISYSIQDLKIRTDQNSSIGFASYKTSFTGKHKDQEMTVEAIESLMLIMEGDDWQIAHMHTSNKMA